MINIHQTVSQVECYDDVFISIIKVRIIQSMIQIERPMGWNMENISRQDDPLYGHLHAVNQQQQQKKSQ